MCESPFFFLYPEGVWTFDISICEMAFEKEEAVLFSIFSNLILLLGETSQGTATAAAFSSKDVGISVRLA